MTAEDEGPIRAEAPPPTEVALIRPATLPLRLPRSGANTVVRGADFDNAMQQLEQADARNVKAGTTPAVPAIILTGEDGSSWRLTVGPGGALKTTQVPRT